jgi:thioredoxin reductase
MLAPACTDREPRLMHTYDVAVIGGGAAGLSAALVLSRARRAVAVIDAGQPRNAPAAHLHGFLSRDGVAPSQLLATGRAEIAGYGGHLVSGEVTDVYRTDTGFRVHRTDGEPLTARRLLVTTGLHDVLPDVEGARDRWGRDLLHCPYCHGYEVRDQPLGVLGGTQNAVEHALLVRQWSADLVYFAHGDALTDADSARLAARAVDIVVGRVTRLVVADDRLVGVALEDGRVVPRIAVFTRPRMVANSALLDALGAAADDRGWVRANVTGRTTAPGVYVAGNVANPRGQVITAAGEGSAAAIAINADLTDEDVALAVLTASA